MSGGAKVELLGKSKAELRALCVRWGEAAYRGDQIYQALYVERKFDLGEVTSLPVALREKLREEASVALPEVKQRFFSVDGSVRYLFGLSGGEEKENTPGSEGGRYKGEDSAADNVANGTAVPEKSGEKKLRRGPAASVEAVFMPSEGRQTICISTQAGCAVDCQFCMTAQLGLIRNLTAGEIVAQVLVPLEEQREKLAPRTNIVLMGQGEPLLNFENVMGAVRILLDQAGMKIAPRHVTLSTSGIVPGIEKLALEKVRPKLAISLNASSDEQRDVLMPINKKYPLAKLLAACKKFPMGTREYITFEYVLLGGVNDTPEDARRVARLLSDVGRVKVNLIPWNPGPVLPYREPTEDALAEFHRILMEKGVPTFTRYSRGRDVMAACGQLALNEAQGGGLVEIGAMK